ncbi:hypothetical protein [Thaumasiovibrio subtropicus]|uniref:hypothetical protein n=1 Tax=Thaumasiovibrio subtropicus TaxID=1891207 RepID=UPI000B35701E|nr:hypothetical protein [Thaumasiovibrio subtropicus]
MKPVWIGLWALGLTACVNQIDGHYTPVAIDVIGVDYHYQGIEGSQSYKVQSQAMMAFMEQHKPLLLKEAVTVYWDGNQGKKLAKAAQQWMLKVGVPPMQISMMAAELNSPLEIVIATHHVQVPLCQPVKAEALGAGAFNCYSESARWQSLVHPEKMLNTNRE